MTPTLSEQNWSIPVSRLWKSQTRLDQVSASLQAWRYSSKFAFSAFDLALSICFVFLRSSSPDYFSFFQWPLNPHSLYWLFSSSCSTIPAATQQDSLWPLPSLASRRFRILPSLIPFNSFSQQDFSGLFSHSSWSWRESRSPLGQAPTPYLQLF